MFKLRRIEATMIADVTGVMIALSTRHAQDESIIFGSVSAIACGFRRIIVMERKTVEL